MHWLSWESMWTKFLCISVLRVASGPRVKLAGCKKCFKPNPPTSPPPPVRTRWFILLTILRQWSPGADLTLGCFVVYSTRRFVFLFCSCVFSLFSIAITSLGGERANLSAFRTFVWFALVWFCLFPLPLGVWVAACDCGTPWTFLLPFLLRNIWIPVSSRAIWVMISTFSVGHEKDGMGKDKDRPGNEKDMTIRDIIRNKCLLKP